MQVERNDVCSLVVNQLPDGSKVILDSENDRVLALNATAGAAWDACSEPKTLSEVAEHMQSSLGSEITEEIAEESILRLQEQNLVHASGLPNRRQFMTTLGAVALPVVVSLTTGTQRAFAGMARSTISCPAHDSPRNGKLPIQHAPHHPVKGPFTF
jgi:Coenzyme PQQ synthesis protein D (PqqD)